MRSRARSVPEPGPERVADAMYVSESVPGSFSGSWIDREYVYDSDASLSGSMKDPRAAVRVKIVCGRLDEGDVRSVFVSNRLTGARFYLEGKDDIPRGFYLDDESTYTTDSRTLYSCPAGSPMHITTDPATEWTSEEVLFPAMAYSALPDTKRPVVTVVLGAASLEVPFTARVALNQDLEPMKEYTYTLPRPMSMSISPRRSPGTPPATSNPSTVRSPSAWARWTSRAAGPKAAAGAPWAGNK